LRKEIKEGIPTARVEPKIDVVEGDPPLFIDKPRLNDKVLHEMHPILEAWSGIELMPIVAYGFRLYRNQSSLVMHLDETRTHVISCIYHIDSSDDAEPWPLLIEDYHGNTNEVILMPGDVLLYVSACKVLICMLAYSCSLTHFLLVSSRNQVNASMEDLQSLTVAGTRLCLFILLLLVENGR